MEELLSLGPEFDWSGIPDLKKNISIDMK